MSFEWEFYFHGYCWPLIKVLGCFSPMRASCADHLSGAIVQSVELRENQAFPVVAAVGDLHRYLNLKGTLPGVIHRNWSEGLSFIRTFCFNFIMPNKKQIS